MRGIVAACSIAVAIAIAGEARADGFDFDEAFRHWGDEDHMGMRVVVGPNALRSHGEEDHLGVGTSASAWGQGVAYSYWPDTPRSFRFSGFGTVGVLTSGEVTSFDGGIGSELMIGYRLTLPDFDGSKDWPRDELVVRTGVGAHVEGNHLLYSSALEAPRLELGYRRASWHGSHSAGQSSQRHSYVFEIRAVAALLATGSYHLTRYERALDVAPAWGGQLDLVGVRPELNLSYLRVFSDLTIPVDRVDARGCIKFGPKDYSHHPYMLCGQGRLQYAIDADAALDAVSLRAGLSFGWSD